jgi:superfamily II DNA or RNA helicase
MSKLDPKRFVTGAQRRAIERVHGGTCANPHCGNLIDDHHHVKMHSAFGPTQDSSNISPLCLDCHGKLWDPEWQSMRRGQELAMRALLSQWEGTHLIELHVGHGKTRVAVDLVKAKAEFFDHVWYVVPSDQLRSDVVMGLNAAGISAEVFRSVHNFFPEDTKAFVTSFQTVSMTDRRAQIEAINGKLKQLGKLSLLICDEAHHASDNNTWGKALSDAFEQNTTMHVFMSGTPFRTDQDRIAMIRGKKPLARWRLEDEYREPNPCVEYATFTKLTTKVDGIELKDYQGAIGPVVGDIAGPDSFGYVIADQALQLLRECRETQSDAGLLFKAGNVLAAEAFHELFEHFGASSVCVHEGTKNADAVIDRFRNGNSEVIVAVDKISEGVDIPRLEVIGYASPKATPTEFIQTVGRGIRCRQGVEGPRPCRVVIPDHPKFTELAQQFESYYPEEVVEQLYREFDSTPRALSHREPLFVTTSDSHVSGAIFRDNEATNSQVELVKAQLAPVNLRHLTELVAPQLAPLMSQSESPAASTRTLARAQSIHKPRVEARKTEKEKLTAHLNRRVKAIANESGLRHSRVWVKLKQETDVADDLNIHNCTVPQLEAMITVANEWLDGIKAGY